MAGIFNKVRTLDVNESVCVWRMTAIAEQTMDLILRIVISCSLLFDRQIWKP